MSVKDEDQYHMVSPADLPSSGSDDESANEEWTIVTPPSNSILLPSSPTILTPSTAPEQTNAGPSKRKLSVQQLCQTLPPPPVNCKRLPANHIQHEREFNEMGHKLLQEEKSRVEMDKRLMKTWAEIPPAWRVRTEDEEDGLDGPSSHLFKRWHMYPRDVHDLGLGAWPERWTNTEVESGATHWDELCLKPEPMWRREYLSREEESRRWEAGMARQHQEMDQALERLGRELGELESEHSIDPQRPLNPLAPSFPFRQSPEPLSNCERT